MIGAGLDAMDSPAAMNGTTYTYTDDELQSLLTSVLDEGHSGTLELPTGRGSGHEGAHSLQFLPHLPMPSSHTSSDQEPTKFVPSDLSGVVQPLDDAPPLPLQASPLGLPPLRTHVLPQAQPHQLHANGGAMVDLDLAGGRPSSYTIVLTAPALQQQQARPQGRAPAQRAAGRLGPSQRAASLPAGAAANPKQPHSIVEKQRRDRINFLIDELRELVPPQGASSSEHGGSVPGEVAGATDSRRPKHVVLSDTIRLIKDLQVQLAEMQLSPSAVDSTRAWHVQLPGNAFDMPQPQEEVQHWHAAPSTRVVDVHWHGAAHQQQQQPQMQSAVHPAQQSPQVAGQQPVQQQGSRHSSDGPRPELPLAPDGDAALDSGVVVECEEGRIRYVKVTCPDRHGLLADVVRALRELPLEITTAAITTRSDHVVYDVFQVDVADLSLTPDQLRCAVEAALRLPTEKKRKQEFAESLCGAQA